MKTETVIEKEIEKMIENVSMNVKDEGILKIVRGEETLEIVIGTKVHTGIRIRILVGGKIQEILKDIKVRIGIMIGYTIY